VARITKETDPAILFLTDATQTAGKLPLDLAGAMRHVDLLAFSGHKLHAPKGGRPLRPARHPVRLHDRGPPGGRATGRHQERPYIAGLARAVELSREDHDAVEAASGGCGTGWSRLRSASVRRR
jgi:cysteine sulfinate desulfinase/cysteine desulfurase-like protein